VTTVPTGSEQGSATITNHSIYLSGNEGDANLTNSSAGSYGSNYTWSDPPLNTSASNPYYYNNAGWVINVPGHEWVMDLNTSHNTGSGVTLSGNTFSGFGSGFAILINTPNVIFDGMGAILNGRGNTEYGIIVNNQSAINYGTFLNTYENALGGISITNITLTGFTKAGILFNNVIGTLPAAETASNITHVNASNNPQTGSGNGIVLQNSQYVEISRNTVNNNSWDGILLQSSSNNNIQISIPVYISTIFRLKVFDKLIGCLLCFSVPYE